MNVIKKIDRIKILERF